MEYWDIYDKYRGKTGKTHTRGEKLKNGDLHLVVHVWIVDDEGNILIQKRQSDKVLSPDMWDSSVAGSAQAGDDSYMTAEREVKEEIGIDLDMENTEHVFTIPFSRGFDDIFITRQNVKIEDLNIQHEEVADVRLVTRDEIAELMDAGEFVPYHNIKALYDVMDSGLSLYKAVKNDASELLALQREVFTEIYNKYQDHETSPVNQTMDRFIKRFDIGDYYKIVYKDKLAGSVFVYEKAPGIMRFHIINIKQEYQNKGIGQMTMKRLEMMYPHIKMWELETILSEERNCHLYEKLGYKRYGDEKKINDKLTLISYRKTDGMARVKI